MSDLKTKIRKRITQAEYLSNLLTKAWGLYYRLDHLQKVVEPLLDKLPVGSEERSQLSFALISAQAALKEHDPGKP